jgi:hypothetical protein
MNLLVLSSLWSEPTALPDMGDLFHLPTLDAHVNPAYSDQSQLASDLRLSPLLPASGFALNVPLGAEATLENRSGDEETVLANLAELQVSEPAYWSATAAGVGCMLFARRRRRVRV